MATLRSQAKLADVTLGIRDENPRNGQSRNTSVPRMNEEPITQVSEEIEGRVTKKLSQVYSRTESRILGALSKLDEFLLNQQIRTHSGTVPQTFRNTNVDNQGTSEDDSQSGLLPEAGLFRSQTTQNSGSEVGSYTSQSTTNVARSKCSQDLTFTDLQKSNLLIDILSSGNFLDENFQPLVGTKMLSIHGNKDQRNRKTAWHYNSEITMTAWDNVTRKITGASISMDDNKAPKLTQVSERNAPKFW